MALLELAAEAAMTQGSEQDDDVAVGDGGAYQRKARTSHTAHQKAVMAKCELRLCSPSTGIA